MSQCTVCKHLSSRTVLYICNSGHVACENCQLSGSQQYSKDDKKFHMDPMRTTKSSSSNKTNDFLASGDCKTDRDKELPKKCVKVIDINKNTHGNRVKSKKTNKDKKAKVTPENIVQNKNKNYCAHQSSTLTILTRNILADAEFKETVLISKCPPLPRPIACPVCAKMITVNSIQLHFYFDHSKVPRMNISRNTPQQISFKVIDVSMTTECYAVLLEDDGPQTLRSDEKYIRDPNKHCFLLMGTKVIHSVSENITQSEKQNKSIVKLENNGISKHFNDSDDIMFWVSKLHDDEVIYDVTVLKDDRKLCFSYTGAAMHMKEKQDAITMYQNVCCLIIRGKAANRLITSSGHLNVFVNIR